ncbi:hypothetical protein [Sphingomonas daechungensis]|uniref:hypothetical protein n=1 Tax=Sphingomonas daechungensis TaxID=1176646 RepID=UPI001CB9A639|nr:hypothetical protein [Sphingomonas daechungensis]
MNKQAVTNPHLVLELANEVAVGRGDGRLDRRADIEPLGEDIVAVQPVALQRFDTAVAQPWFVRADIAARQFSIDSS